MISRGAELVGARVGGNAERGQPAQHHQRIVGTAAQRLRPCQQVHERGVVARPLLDGPPREIMRALVVALCDGRLDLGAALDHTAALPHGLLA